MDSFVALMSRSGVAKLFLDDAFQNEMEYWRDKLGRDKKEKLRFAKLTPAMLTRLTTHRTLFDNWLKEVQDLSKQGGSKRTVRGCLPLLLYLLWAPL